MYVAQLNKLLYERLTVGFALRRSKLVQEKHVTLTADRMKKNPSWLRCSRFSSLQALYFYLSFLWVSIRSLSCDCLYRIFQFSVILYVQISRKKRSCATKVLTILTLTAMPLRSEEAELPVWVVLGTVFVLVSLIMILDAGILKHLAATCKNIT